MFTNSKFQTFNNYNVSYIFTLVVHINNIALSYNKVCIGSKQSCS